MKELNMIKGNVNESNPVVYLSIEESVTNQFDGLFYSLVDCGQTVSEGTL